MRIVLVDNLLLERNGQLFDYVLQPHLGLISLIAVVESAGHQGLLYDPKLEIARGRLCLDESLYREAAYGILRLCPDVVGLTSLGCNFICTLKIASYLRSERPEMPILLGGPHASVLDRVIMEQFPQFDLVVRNEAELKILPVLDALADRRFEAIPGITYRQGREVIANAGEPAIDDLDSLPLPAYDHYPIEALHLSWLRVEAGRGCPFLCSFCSTASFFGRRYRLKSAARLCADLDQLHARYGVSHFSLTHDLFTVNRNKVIAFCQEVAGRGYTWKCSARMDCVDPELLGIMSESGCREIYYGVETGSRRMQKVVQKRLDLSLFTPTLDATDRLGMTATVSFITGYPQEEGSDQDETLDLIGSCFYRETPPHYVQLHLLTPEPGTRLIEEFREEMDYDGYVTDFNFPTLESDDSAIMRGNPDIFVNHHHFRSALPRRRHVLVTSLYGLLFRFGPVVITAILDRYDRRLSRFVEEVDRWAGELGLQPPLKDDALCDFFVAAWGSEDWLTSLVRYKVAAIRLANEIRTGRRRPAAVDPVASAENGRELAYRLSAKVGILRRLHDCPELLDRLSAARRAARAYSIPRQLLARRRHYLLLAESASDRVRNFELDGKSLAVVETFERARTVEEAAAALAEKGIEPEAAVALCRQFVELGILERPLCKEDDGTAGEDRRAGMKLVEWGEVPTATGAVCHG